MIFKSIPKSLVFNFAGTILDKMLPILVTAFLTNSMSIQTINNWTLFYQYMIFTNIICFATLTTRFSRVFFLTSDKHFVFDNYGLSIFTFTILTLIYYFISKNHSNLILQIFGVLSASLYNYFVHYLRFCSRDKIFFYSSILRFLIFTLLIIIFIIDGEISFLELLIAFLLSSIFFLYKIFSRVKKTKFFSKDLVKEDMSLIAYGVSASAINGADRFIIGYFFLGGSFLGYYNLIYSITNLPTIFTESVKKSLNPQVYKDLSESGAIRNTTKKHITIYSIIIIVLQFTLPFIAIYFLTFFNLINKSLLEGRNLYLCSIYLSIGFVFQGFYHLINPIYFFYKKANYLMGFQVISFCSYLIIINTNIKNEILFYLANTIMLMLITILTYFLSKYKMKNNTLVN